MDGFNSTNYQSIGTYEEKMRIEITQLRVKMWIWMGIGGVVALLFAFTKMWLSVLGAIFFFAIAVGIIYAQMKFKEFMLRQKKKEDKRWEK
jgi:hypothetical protein